MLIDDVKIKVVAGNGGEGAQTYLGFKRAKKLGQVEETVGGEEHIFSGFA